MDTLKVSVSGVRGIVGDSLTPPVIIEYVSAFADFIKQYGNHIAVARDTRPTGELVNRLVIGTLQACGLNVTDYGILPTPVLIYAVREKKFAGGVIITASHNPLQWNALKFIKKDGYFLNAQDVNTLILKREKKVFDYVSYQKIGVPENNENSFIPEYIDDLLCHFDVDSIKQRGLKVGYDPVNATGAFVTPSLIARLNCNLYGINEDTSIGFARGAEPIAENLGGLSELVKGKKLDIGFAHDPDGDRLALVDEQGNPIGEEYTLALAAYSAYKYRNLKSDMVVNLSTSLMTGEIAKQYGKKAHAAGVGEINVTEKMIEIKSELGGEGNGGVIYPAFNSCRDSFVSMLFILELLALEKKPLSEIIKNLPYFVMVKEKFSGEFHQLEAVYQKLKEAFSGCIFDEQDGLKILGNDFWLHIRKSNTEPVVRIIAESPSEETNQTLLKQAQQILGV